MHRILIRPFVLTTALYTTQPFGQPERIRYLRQVLESLHETTHLIQTSKLIAITNLFVQLLWNLQSTIPATSTGTANSTTIQTHSVLKNCTGSFSGRVMLCNNTLRYTQIHAL